MELQTWIALTAVAAALLYFIRATLADLRGTGKCASGCGNCPSKACPAKQLKRRLPRRA